MNKYFIDCGAHCGESILMARHKFGQYITTISFEPIPYFASELQKIYENNENTHIVNAAVWINDDVKKFYISTEITDGSSLLGEKINDVKDENVYINIPCVDLSTWIKDNFTEDDYVILKLDIEGAEYEVLNKMIEDGSIKLIKELWGEWHENSINDEKIDILSNKIKTYLKENDIELKIWEMHIPKVGKAHELLVERPERLLNILDIKK
jgi:FkbM family methyltransferase